MTGKSSRKKNQVARGPCLLMGHLAILVGLLTLIGWKFELTALKSVRAGWVSMKANTALSFIALGLGLHLKFGRLPPVGWRRHRRRLADIACGFAIAVGALSLFEHITSINLGIDQLLFSDPLRKTGGFPGRVSVMGSLNFTLLGISLSLSHYRRTVALSQFFAAAVTLLTIFPLLGYAFGLHDLQYGVLSFVHMAIHTASLFFVLSLAVGLCRARHGFWGLTFGRSSGGILMRRLGPTVTLSLLTLAYLRHRTEKLGLVGSEFGMSLMIFAAIIITLGLVFFSAKLLNRLDEQQKKLSDNLKITNQELERRVLEKRFKLEQAQLRVDTILNSTPILLFALDTQNIFTFCDGKALRDRSIDPKSIIGTHAMDRYGTPEMSWMRAAVIQAQSGLAVTVEGCAENRYYEVHLTPQKDNHQRVTAVIGLCIDITERKLADREKARASVGEQAALESARVKANFLANMSHEIRTPLNGIIGLTNLLRDTTLDAEQRDLVETIRSSGDALLAIVNDILDLSKIEAGKMPLEIVDFDVRQLVQNLAKTLQHVAQTRSIDLRLDLEALATYKFKGDPSRIRQVLMNLVSNALKFTESGRVVIRVASRDAPANLNRLRFEVTDNGIGISPQSQKHLFQAFTQADASTTRRFGGTGLGLSICKRLVEAMKGQIGVTSELGKGSTFWFEISLAAGAQRPVLQSEERIGRFDNEGQVRRILVVEDNPTNQRVALGMLKKLGCRADCVADGREAVKAIQSIPYDLILMDCHMPEMDGYQATQAIRSLEGGRFATLPILAMTANAGEGEEQKCLAAGMNDFISKPVSLKLLYQLLSRWLPEAMPMSEVA